MVLGCRTADIGGEGAVGGAPHPLVVVAAMPQSVGCSFDSWSGSFVVGNSEVWLSAKVHLSRISRGRLVSATAGAAATLVALWLALITAAAAWVILRA